MGARGTITTLALAVAAAVAAVAAVWAPVFAAEPAEQAEVLVEDFVYQPSDVTIAAGGSVTWTIGDDPDQHTVTPRNEGDFEDSGQLFEGDTYTVTFNEPGTVEYFCRLHPTMVGFVRVAAAATPAPVSSPSAAPTAPSLPTESPTTAPAAPSVAPTVAPTAASSPAPSAPAASDAGSALPLLAAAALALGLVALLVWRARRASAP